jgi:hypothetical protein
MEPEDGFEPLLLQAKQAQRSVLARYAGYHRTTAPATSTAATPSAMTNCGA